MLRTHSRVLGAAILVAASTISLPAVATAFDVSDILITGVSVNGGSDTVNPGTSCVRISAPVPAVCTNGYVAIQNNNKQLLSAALQAKATGSKVWFYYADSGNFHCPGRVFTACSVIGIELLQ